VDLDFIQSPSSVDLDFVTSTSSVHNRSTPVTSEADLGEQDIDLDSCLTIGRELVPDPAHSREYVALAKHHNQHSAWNIGQLVPLSDRQVVDSTHASTQIAKRKAKGFKE